MVSTVNLIGQMPQILPREHMDRLLLQLQVPGTLVATVYSTQMLMESPAGALAHTVVPRADLAMDSGKTANIFQVLRTSGWSESFLVHQTTLQKFTVALILQIMTIFLSKLPVTMFQNLFCNSRTPRWIFTSLRIFSLRVTRHLLRYKNTPFLSSWLVET